MRKLTLSLVLALALVFPAAATAADITITVSAAQVARLTAAFRYVSGNPNASMADVKAHLIRELRAIVLSAERKTAEDAVAIPGFDPS